MRSSSGGQGGGGGATSAAAAGGRDDADGRALRISTLGEAAAASKSTTHLMGLGAAAQLIHVHVLRAVDPGYESFQPGHILRTTGSTPARARARVY